jgi:hypothetical protein
MAICLVLRSAMILACLDIRIALQHVLMHPRFSSRLEAAQYDKALQGTILHHVDLVTSRFMVGSAGFSLQCTRTTTSCDRIGRHIKP